MYAIAVNGSPRAGGNTEILLKETLNQLDDSGWESSHPDQCLHAKTSGTTSETFPLLTYRSITLNRSSSSS